MRQKAYLITSWGEYAPSGDLTLQVPGSMGPALAKENMERIEFCASFRTGQSVTRGATQSARAMMENGKDGGVARTEKNSEMTGCDVSLYDGVRKVRLPAKGKQSTTPPSWSPQS